MKLSFPFATRYLPVVCIPGLTLYACFGAASRAIARQNRLKLVAQADPADFIDAARQMLGHLLLGEASGGLASRLPEFSASRRLTGLQSAYAIAVAAILGLAVSLLSMQALWALSCLLGGLFFLSIIALRILCLLPPAPHSETRRCGLAEQDLPVYSVLVPLFREIAVLDQLLSALDRLDYPGGKLDIKLILEESDLPMRRAIENLVLPGHYDVIVVPPGRPQTKPRALNYALQFARGSLLTIYDAEDIPEPKQLRRSAQRFADLAGNVACLQAELCFYNPNENWLSRQFTIEYATLFGLLLPALASYGLPLPLGGTSNHFRTAVLRRVSAWDPFNVTEDADLGLRLARLGYRAATLQSRTYEEANVRLGNWMRQRARWLKGFMQTWLVHMRQPLRFAAEVGATGFWTAQAVTAGVFAFALLHPVCLALTVWLVATDRVLPKDGTVIPVLLAGLSLAVFVSGYAVSLLAGRRAIRKLGIRGWWFSLCTMPAYWLLMSAAAWLGLWQFISAPFYWNKTEHGLSTLQRRRLRP